jgi:hypothetical protein
MNLSQSIIQNSPRALRNSVDAQAADLALTLQAMELAPPRQISLVSSLPVQIEAPRTRFNLFMKVAHSGVGTEKPISVAAVKADLARAWRQSFYDISLVSFNKFMAHFRDRNSMFFVWSRQPWSVNRENLLIEWVEPSKPLIAYTFEYMYVTVKLFGIPPAMRTMQLLEHLINVIGPPSDLEPLHDNILFRDPQCITVRIRVNVTLKVVDRIQIPKEDKEHLTVYVHYEKIHRICTYCAEFFHNVNFCPERNEALVTQRMQDRTKLVPFVRYGSWLTQVTAIPREAS